GEGLEELREAVVTPFSPEDVSTSGFLVTDARHHDLLVRARAEIGQSVEQLNEKMSEEIVLVGLHNALRFLGEITGETTTEDMLTRIFSTFCIRKKQMHKRIHAAFVRSVFIGLLLAVAPVILAQQPAPAEIKVDAKVLDAY